MKDNKLHVFFRTALALILTTLIAPQVFANAASDSALRKCAGIADDESRLVCFDALASVLVSADNPVTREDAPATVPAPAPVPAPDITAAAPASVVVAAGVAVALTDEVGKERVIDLSEIDNPTFTAKMTSCPESVQSGQYYFTFENGQVWKQSNYRKMNLGDCDYDVEITKISMGYQMYIPSKDRRVRISRVK
jgi:hypothetical protein